MVTDLWRVSGKIDIHRTLSLVCGLAFCNGWNDRNVDYCVNTHDKTSTSRKNFMNFGPVTREKRLFFINKWNSLPDWVVSANTTNTFKARLDKFWHNQYIVYDFRAQLQGTGSRSAVLCEEF